MRGHEDQQRCRKHRESAESPVAQLCDGDWIREPEREAKHHRDWAGDWADADDWDADDRPERTQKRKRPPNDSLHEWAERLARDGCRVKLVVNAAMAGEALQIYTRNHYLARLYRLGVEVIPHARLYGSDADCVYFQNTLTDEPVIFDDIDTLVLSLGQQAESQLENELLLAGIEAVTIGDCVLPRTAEEAIYEGLQTAINL